MSEPREVREREKVGTMARIIHGAISLGLVVIFAVFLYLRNQATIEFSAGTARALRLSGFVILAAAVLGAQLMRGRIRPPERSDDRCAWWTGTLPQATVVWAVAEAGGLAAIVLGWLIGDTTLLALGAAVGLALLFVSRPSRMEMAT